MNQNVLTERELNNIISTNEDNDKYFDGHDDIESNGGSTNALQNSYELYKSVMDKIISDLSAVLVVDDNELCNNNHIQCLRNDLLKLKNAVEDTIIDPIISGILCSIDDLDRISSTTSKKHGIKIIDCYNNQIYSDELKFGGIDARKVMVEFGIEEKIKTFYLSKHIKQNHSYKLSNKNKQTGKKMKEINSKYIMKQVESFLPIHILPYDVKYQTNEK